MNRMMRSAETDSAGKIRALWGLATLLFLSVCGLIIADTFIGLIAAGLSFYSVLIPLGLFLLLRGLYLLIVGQKLNSLKPAFFGWLFCILAIWVFYQSNVAGERWETRRIEKFVANAAAPLAQIKAKSGKYPAKLPADLQNSMPRILTYSSKGESYAFTYGRGFDFHGYDSETHSWWSD